MSQLPLLHERPNVNLPDPSASGLCMQIPITIRNSIGTNLRIWSQILQPLLRPRDINHSIDNSMTDMHTLWPIFFGQTRTQRP
jgi:hypothetical protein